jgi:hypothetical protein
MNKMVNAREDMKSGFVKLNSNLVLEKSSK